MRLTLIKPNIGRKGHSLYVDEARMEPLALGVLAALTPPDVEVKLYDDRMEAVPFDEPTDLVAITVETFTARRAYEICLAYRERKVPVVLGGMHVNLLPEEAMRHCDAIVLGDAEGQWAAVIGDARRGRLRAAYRGAFSAQPQARVLPRRDLFEGKGYLPVTLLQFSRGCPHRCGYCATSAYFRQRHFCRDVAAVLREIESQERRLLFFVDDNITADREKAKELFRALIPLKVRWISQASIDMLEDPALMELMMKSGCLGHVVGFESIRDASLIAMDKEVNRRFAHNRYEEAVQKLRGWGLQTWAAFTVGHDGDTADSIRETYRFALRSKFTFAAYNILMPYPGTPLYERLNAEGRLLYGGKWWLHPAYRFNYAAFCPKKMTAEELTEVSFWCRKQFNSRASILYRAFDFKTNMRTPYRFFAYCLYNPLFKKEVFKKQGMEFGFGDRNFMRGE